MFILKGLVFDLHRHNIDHITIPSSRGPEYGVLRRVDDVFDCWFESGSMPYAYIHYPFENVELFEKNFPGHFVAEGLDQTRGWFYTLMVLATALFGKPAFRNLICNGLVLAEDGKKMSKSLKNYPSPMEVINDYGADALRLYLINSPVVRAETLRFKKEGVYGVVRDVFLPWYNAYRFLVQNAKRLEVEGLAPFVPIDHVTLQKSSNVLDQWINSATQSLVIFVRKEMDGYRLYTVVPYLLKFLDNLTNIYVRFNRKRLKGRTGEDCRTALSTLYNVLLLSCKVMAPFTPFFTEVLYQNMRKVCNGSEESIHYCSFPQEEGKGGERIEQSVSRMMTIIDLARNIRERHNKPLKTPLREMVIVHPDADFLEDIAGKLREYVLEELNIRSLVTCNDTLKYSSLRAEPDFSVLGKRLGKSMGVVAKEIKALSQENILAFESAGEVIIANHCLKLTDIKVLRDFKRPDGMTEKEIDAAGDGDVLVILDLRPDESLFEAGAAREIVNRIQKLRKKVALEPTDMVEVYFESLDEDKSVSQRVLHSQESYIGGAIGSPLLLHSMMPPHAVVLGEEKFHGISGMSFGITLARPALMFNSKAILALFSGEAKFGHNLQTYLLSRDHSNLKSEFQERNGKKIVDSIENQPAVEVVLGEHVFLTVGAPLSSCQ
ncbi:isoleucine--tRNA ligase, cytoplasmic [Senna tora]|uniref:Isoleucine--tRNA ligase, cytoplasmic n=1 Tax=Senna tora TaxID=362788 RepID=A0A834WNC5_9FABA|nr:isoleucine--tRNA ligase, cytoplasmic [Senna tora]